MFSLTISATVLFWTGPLQAQLAENVTEFYLGNGMQVVVIEDHRAPVVNHTLWYRVGSIDDPPGKSGLAHFLEHLMFKSTEAVAAGEFERRIRMRGGRSGASTSHDYSMYRARIFKDHLEEIMRLEADRMQGLVLTQAEINTEREVILEERNQRIDSDPTSLLYEQIAAALFMNHPFGRPVIGWRHEMEGLGLDDVLSFYRRYYRPDNAILVISGDVTVEQVRELAERHYGVLEAPEGRTKRMITTEPPHIAERRLTIRDSRVSNPFVIRSYLAPEDYQGDQHKLASMAVLANILGGSGITSILGKTLQLEQQLAAFTGAYYSGSETRPIRLVLYVVPQPEHSLSEAEEALDGVLEALLEEGIDEDHLRRIKVQLRYSEIYELDESMNSALKFGRGLVQGIPVEQILSWPEALQKVETQDVLEAAQLLLDRRRSVTARLLDDKMES